MKYALEEARKLAEKGATGTYIDDPTVYGWAIHFFEEDSIEGSLYYPDGTEYKPAPKPATKPTVVTKQPEKPKEQQYSLFEMLSKQENTDEEEPESLD